MDVNHNIKMLLDSLMATNKLMTWQIYQERSGNTLVKIRFGYHENGGPALPTDEIQNSNTFFKRKSDKQVRRDTERAKTHSDRITRSTVRSNELVSSDMDRELPRSCDLVNQASPATDAVHYTGTSELSPGFVYRP